MSTKFDPIAISTWDFGLRPVEAAGKLASNDTEPLIAVEEAIKIAEDDPEVLSVGYGGMPNENGIVELDACMIDGPRHLMGSVASLRGIRNPISVARLILETTPHVVLA